MGYSRKQMGDNRGMMIGRRNFLSGCLSTISIPYILDNENKEPNDSNQYEIGIPFERHWEHTYSNEWSSIGGLSEDRVIISYDTGEVSALKIEDGSHDWTQELSGQTIAPRTHKNSLLIRHSENEIINNELNISFLQLTSIDPRTGEILWEYELPPQWGWGFLIVDNLIYLTGVSVWVDNDELAFGDSGFLICLDMDGTLVWEERGQPYFSLNYIDDLLYATVGNGVFSNGPIFNNGTLVAVNPDTGQQVWESVDVRASTHPVQIQDGIAVGTENGPVAVFDSNDGSKIREEQYIGRISSIRTVDTDGILLLHDEVDQEVVAVNEPQNTILWRYTGEHGVTLATANGGIVYLAQSDGTISAHDHITGSEVWGTTFPNNHDYIPLLVQDGYLFIGSYNHQRVDVYRGQRIITADLIEDFSETTGIDRMTAPVANQFSRNEQIELAKEAYDEGDYSTAQHHLSEASSIQSSVEAGFTLGGVFTFGGVSAVAGKRYWSKLQWSKLNTKHGTCQKRIDHIASNLDDSCQGLHAIVDDVDPNSYTEFKKAKQDLEAVEKKLGRMKALVDDYVDLIDMAEDCPDTQPFCVDQRLHVVNEVVCNGSLNDIEYANEELAKAEEELLAVQQRRRLIEKFSSVDSSPINLNLFQEQLSELSDEPHVDVMLDETNRLDTVLNLASRLESILEWDDRLPHEDIVTSLNSAIVTPDYGLESIESELNEFETMKTSSKEVQTFLDSIDSDHPTVNPANWKLRLSNAIQRNNPQQVEKMLDEIEQIQTSVWTRSDITPEGPYDWDDFEKLIAQLWSDLGYRTRVTTGSNDFGIDVFANKGPSRTAIQVKQWSRGNSVGREPIQKIVSAITRGEADKVIVVTTSRFTQTAIDHAREYDDRVELFDGTELLQLLNESNIPPPK